MTPRDEWDFFPPSRPLEVKGGIKARSKRSAFAESWWAQRWLAALEGLGLGKRLDRGRTYARKGQVVSLEVGPGKITAAVQGSRARPYRVTITLAVLSAAERRRVAEILSAQALPAAKLLAGEMPAELETAFAAAGFSLFPSRRGDLETSCSCPDWADPCKHTAAVYYLLAEEFDRDPLLLLTLRGLGREELLELVGGHPGTEAVSPDGDSVDDGALGGSSALPSDPIAFWGEVAGRSHPNADDVADPLHPGADGTLVGEYRVRDVLLGEAHVPSTPGTLLRQLGAFPFWRGETGLLEALSPLYQEASEFGMKLFLGDPRALETDHD